MRKIATNKNIPPALEEAEKNVTLLLSKVNLFKQFSIDLVENVNKTYPGSEGIDQGDVLNHYNWCYNNICKKYVKFSHYFNENQEVKDFFLDILIKNYYCSSDREKDNALIGITNSLNALFSINKTDSKSLTALNNIFKMFNKSIKK